MKSLRADQPASVSRLSTMSEMARTMVGFDMARASSSRSEPDPDRRRRGTHENRGPPGNVGLEETLVAVEPQPLAVG